MRRRAYIAFIAVVGFAIGCSPAGVGRDSRSELDAAIGLFIEGRHQEAASHLKKLTGHLDSDGDVLSAYLYLGRSYMALGDYGPAANAFSTGRSLGGGLEFDEHLRAAQNHLRVTPRNMGAQESLTRAQLAALIATTFDAWLEDTSDPAAAGVADVENHWAREYVGRVRAAGIMDVLPDGAFHPDDVVTAGAFYLVMRHSVEVFGIAAEILESFFPQGLRGAIGGSRAGGRWVSGREATTVLQSLRLGMDG